MDFYGQERKSCIVVNGGESLTCTVISNGNLWKGHALSTLHKINTIVSNRMDYLSFR